MRLKEILRTVFRGGALMPPKEAGPISGLPHLQEEDLDFILEEHVQRKWGGVERVAWDGSPLPKEEGEYRGVNCPKKKPTKRLAALIKKRDRLKREIKKHEN